jgi:HEAT repeat protein
LKLRALFRLQPARCAAAGKRLAQMTDPNASTYAALASALASAGNPESQRALVDAARSADGNVASQRVLVASLGMAKSPTGETLDALGRIVKDTTSGEIAGTGRLALGSLARTDADIDPARAGALVNGEVDAFHRAQSSEEKIMALLALGNSGSPLTLGIAREGLADPDPRVRTAAAMALRFVAAPEAEAMLTMLVGSDSDAGVRVQAIHSLSFRTFGSAAAEAVVRASETDRDEQARLAAVKLLAGGPYDPGLVDLFTRIAANDVADSVRTAARLALVRYKEEG